MAEIDVTEMASSAGTVMAALAGSVVALIVMTRFMQRLPLFSHMVLQPPDADNLAGPRLRPDNEPSENLGELVGKKGIALTMLRPAGRVEIENAYHQVVSEGEFVAAGESIEVISSSKSRIVVRKISADRS